MPLTNPLDILFRDIRRELYAQKLESAKSARKPEPPKPEISPYANPENWTLGDVIELTHAEGPIGVFQEYFFRNCRETRRLLPAAAGSVASRCELVFGDYWLHPKFSTGIVPVEDSEAEIQAIISRFAELMSEPLEEESF